MIHIICKSNRDAFKDVLDDFFRARHEVFVEMRGWEDLRRPDGREIDEYDREDSIYFVRLAGERVLAGCRYTPSTTPPLLAHKLYPELFRGPPPCDPRIPELTRVFARPEAITEGSRSPVVSELLCAGPEMIHLTGCTGVVMLTEFHLVRDMLSWGCWPEPLGIPRETRDGKLMAVISHASPGVAANLREARGIIGPQLVWAASPAARPVLYADLIGCDPISASWNPPGPETPGYIEPLTLMHLHPAEVQAYFSSRLPIEQAA